MTRPSTSAAILTALMLSAPALADPPPPPSLPTTCPTVQCMRVNSVIDNFDGTFDVEFETFNWFDTNPDTGVNRLMMFTGNFFNKICIGGSNPGDRQVEVIGASAPAGWTLVRADNTVVVFETTSTAFEIPELDLCDASVIGGCINGGGPGISTCGNEQGGFVITLKPNIPTGSICSWTANWRHLDEFGLDNGDVMNFGSVSWTFGSLIEDYSNVGYPPASFGESGVDKCARLVQKKAINYARARLKQTAKCIDSINKGKVCDTVKRDQKINKAKTKMEDKIDQFCLTDEQVANIAWCGTTIAGLKTCLDDEIVSTTDAAIAAMYGPQ